MRKTLSSITTAAVLTLMWSGGSVAEETGNHPNLIAASEIKGTKVKNLQNHDIVDINEILMEPTSGRARFVILPIFNATLRAAASWLFFRVARSAHVNPDMGDSLGPD